ncbi:MAG: hypothetical protein ABSF36_01930 [Candidatus Methanomethylicaceae archaeon]|jgi:hypothetical protein
MSTSTQSYFTRSGRLKRLVSGTKQLISYADSTGNGDLISEASMLQSLIGEGVYFVGIPDESYPTRCSGKELNLEGMDDNVTIRIELKAGDLEKTLATTIPTVKRLKESGDKMAETAELILAILQRMKEEEYRGKTHQVASFDPLGERLGSLPGKPT